MHTKILQCFTEDSNKCQHNCIRDFTFLHSWTLVDIALEDRRNKAEKKNKERKFEGKEKESTTRINHFTKYITA